VDKAELGQDLSEYYGFRCQILSHRLLHTLHPSFGTGTIGQIVLDVPNGLSEIRRIEMGSEDTSWIELA
jgi:hypothetical protein